MSNPRRPLSPAEQFVRHIQATLGCLGIGGAVAAYDWRLGVGAFSLLLILTSRFWRTTT